MGKLWKEGFRGLQGNEEQHVLHPVCGGLLCPEVTAMVAMVADVGYKMLGDDAVSAGLANQNTLFH